MHPGQGTWELRPHMLSGVSKKQKQNYYGFHSHRFFFFLMKEIIVLVRVQGGK